MPPKASKRVKDEIIENGTNTPKKGRTTVKIETELIARSSPRSAKTDRKSLREESDPEDEEEEEDIKSARTQKIQSKVAVEKKPKSKPAKRKAEVTEEDADKKEGSEAEAEDKKVTKKRKTKEEKEAEAMPIATRTAIGSLKHAMHIGAHVSGAGGCLLPHSVLQLSLISHRCSTLNWQ